VRPWRRDTWTTANKIVAKCTRFCTIELLTSTLYTEGERNVVVLLPGTTSFTLLYVNMYYAALLLFYININMLRPFLENSHSNKMPRVSQQRQSSL